MMPARIMFSLVVLSLVLTVFLGALATAPTPSMDGSTIVCRALEVHNDSDLKVATVVFHQRDEAQRSQLSSLLHERSGEIVEVQAGDGGWRRARLLRLKSCFGRGLLLLPAPAPFRDRSEFALRVPLGN